jgi:glycogen operon protein
VIFNAYWEPIDFQLPPLPDDFEPWHQIIDTDKVPPEDIGEGVPVKDEKTYAAQARSTIVLNATQVKRA